MELSGAGKNWVRESMRSFAQFVAAVPIARCRTMRGGTVADVERECEGYLSSNAAAWHCDVDAGRDRIAAVGAYGGVGPSVERC